MKDNELYNHFKTRSHTLDEAPGDALWKTITTKMDKPKSSSNPFKLFLGLTTLAVVGLMVYFFYTGNSKPAHQHDSIPGNLPYSAAPAPTAPVTAIDTVKPKKAPKPATKKRKKNFEKATTAQNQEKNTVPKAISFARIKPKDTIPFVLPVEKQPGIKMSTHKYSGKVVLKVQEKITQMQFDSLQAAAVKAYKNDINTLLIISAPGLKPYRQRIPAKSARPSQNGDTIASYGATLDIAKPYSNQTDSLKQEIISFNVANGNPKPEFPGGDKAFFEIIHKNFRIPQINKSMTAKIMVSIEITEDGTMQNLKVVKDPGYGLGEEAMRVIKNITTPWQPAFKNGKPVKSTYLVPITITVKE